MKMKEFLPLLLLPLFAGGPLLSLGGCQTGLARQPPSEVKGPSDSEIAAANSEKPGDLHPGWENQRPIEVSREALDASGQPIESHGNYLALATSFTALQNVRKALEEREHLGLKNHGEAHVMVISKPEFSRLASAGVTMKKIENTADRFQVADADLDPICVGSAQTLVDGKLARTYFLVLRSESLIRIRHEIAKLVHHSDGDGAFDPDLYSPYITLAYTSEALSESSEFFRDSRSCLYPLHLIP